ncbi:restriction endonuclease subunit S [Fructobacillus fructosus]|uniref:restriction endonuclease subunit S n=1 Tax=Fructobacillus fructosus TaxID=1631 RepID=UPI00200A31F5|nr:restriction endonuclease subunit S [Fructobacillus fructosus]MCK8638066.1 restriction endonuclease subunit S [Fructobacillus fructosus]
MTKIKKIPTIRFSRFTEEWEERKLGDTETHFTDGNYGESYPSAKDMSDKENGIPFLRGSDFSNGYLDSSNANYIKPEKHAELTSGHIKQDDIVLAVRGSLGTLGYATKENEGWNINSQLAILRTNKSEISGMFLIQYLLGSKGQKEIFSRNTGTALKQLPIKQLKDIPVPVPTLLEQQKIGNFFKELDSTIALHQRKLDLLKEQKKGYLQKMFPKNGAKVPELRFDGFADDWEERKLGDEVRIVMGQSPNSENYTDDPNDYILVQGNADMKNGRVFPRVWTTQVTKQAEKDDLILSVRAPVGDIGKTDYDVVIGRGVAAIKGNEFIFQNLGKMKSDGYWTRYSTGSTFESINSTDIKEAIISVPAIEEQNKIGSFFKQLDDTIALHQRKLDLLKEQKKGYLQKMFV